EAPTVDGASGKTTYNPTLGRSDVGIRALYYYEFCERAAGEHDLRLLFKPPYGVWRILVSVERVGLEVGAGANSSCSIVDDPLVGCCGNRSAPDDPEEAISFALTELHALEATGNPLEETRIDREPALGHAGRSEDEVPLCEIGARSSVHRKTVKE